MMSQFGNASFGERLGAHVEAIEAIEREIASLKEARKDRFQLAKVEGFCTRTMRLSIRERKRTREEREDERVMLDSYLALLGSLDGTPMGDLTRKKMDEIFKRARKPDEADGDEPPAETPAPAPMSPADIDLARSEGHKAARTGKSVLENPYPPADPRRSAWDEGWCKELGATGMEIPKELQRKKKKDDKPAGDAGDTNDSTSDEEKKDA